MPADQPPAVVSLAGDYGGVIAEYARRAEEYRAAGTLVRIDGPCFSACTLIPLSQPPDSVCIGLHGALGFHAGTDVGGRIVGLNDKLPTATEQLWSRYPKNIRDWITVRGGLTQRHLWLAGTALGEFFERCAP